MPKNDELFSYQIDCDRNEGVYFATQKHEHKLLSQLCMNSFSQVQQENESEKKVTEVWDEVTFCQTIIPS